MIKFVLNKLTTLFILFGGFSGMYNSTISNIIYLLWIIMAGGWALLNALALIECCRKDAKKCHINAIKNSGFELYNAQRAIALTVVAILCFLIQNQQAMALAYMITTLPYTIIMYHYTKALEQKRQKRYNK